MPDHCLQFVVDTLKVGLQVVGRDLNKIFVTLEALRGSSRLAPGYHRYLGPRFGDEECYDIPSCISQSDDDSGLITGYQLPETINIIARFAIGRRTLDQKAGCRF
jgi:hypothetical protein